MLIFAKNKWLLLLLLLVSFEVYSDIRADNYAKARIELIKNRIASVKERLKCKKDYPEDYNNQTSCIDGVIKSYTDFKLPASLANELAEVVVPDTSKITKQCEEELGKDAHPSLLSNCEAASIGKFFQTKALIRSGIVPESYFDPEYSEKANAELTKQLEDLQNELEIHQSLIAQTILVRFEGMECKVSAQQEAWLDRPDCLHRYNLEAPDGYQFCKSISETDNGSRPDKDNAVKLTWGYIYFDDHKFNDGTRKIKGRYVDTHATGGPWHDKYSAVSRAQADILFVNVKSSKNDLENIACYVPPMATPTESDESTSGHTPHMTISMDIQKNPLVSHTGTLTIRAEGIPPYSISYLVEAFREGEWHEVQTGTIKFTKPLSTTISDIYWHNAEIWRVTRL